MKKLFIIRHAKSDWGLNVSDINRSLMDSGIHDATLVATEALNFLPETYRIYSSVARRAHDTCHIFAAILNFPINDIIFLEQLYTFEGSMLEKIIRSLGDENENVMVFGHNEAITDLVNKLGSIAIDNVPTSGFIMIEFNANSWSSIQKGTTLKTIFPRDLR